MRFSSPHQSFYIVVPTYNCSLLYLLELCVRKQMHVRLITSALLHTDLLKTLC